jgi:glutamyl-Q tRNA(Asp) synthetase
LTEQATIGRFAPSPTGPLHFGSLIAATASYLCAKQEPQGKWLLRIEDVDSQREQHGAAKDIIQTLESYGFEWDGDIINQSPRGEIYQAAIESLKDLVYSCSCTRSELRALATNEASKYSYIYPGFCRDGIKNKNIETPSIRLTTNAEIVCFTDRCQPDDFCQNIEEEVGDFILKRSDGLYAYHLAVVVDDALQNVTQIVRGADLFDSTPRQIYLQRLLGYTQPTYLHFPVAVNANGKKLSKQNLSPQIDADKKRATLVKVLNFLGQDVVKAADYSTLHELWDWAHQHWDIARIPKTMAIEVNESS